MADLNVYLLEMRTKAWKIVGHNESIWQKVEVLFWVPVLHALDIDCHQVFSSELDADGEVINPLVLTESFVKVRFACSVGPQDVPVMSVCLD